MLTSCAEVPESILKTETVSGDTHSEKRETADYVTVPVSELNDYSSQLYEYIEKQGYSDKFILNDGIKINEVSELYTLTLTETSDFEQSFPEFYEYLFGRDFYEDSGVSSFDELPPYSYPNHLPFTYDELFDEIEYVNIDTIDPDTNAYTMYLRARRGGDLVYENNEASFNYDNHFKEYFYANRGLPDTSYTMLDGTEWTLPEAADFAKEKMDEIYALYSKGFEFEPYMIVPNEAPENEGKFFFSVIMRRLYGGVPFRNIHIFDDTNEVQSKPMYYECDFFGKEELSVIINNTGTENVTDHEKVTKDIIPVTSALDILNDELASYMVLEINDISLVYYNEFDASRFVEIAKKDWEDRTEEEKRIVAQPYGVPGTEFKCFPAWEFRLKSNLWKDEEGYSSENLLTTDVIYVNALTGEMMPYLN